MKKFLYFLFPVLVIFSLVMPAKALTLEDGDLIKGSQPAVYYFKENKRFAFPNEQIFFSWFNGFSGIKVINDTQLQDIPLSGNLTFRPGKVLLKVQTDPKVYAIDSGNVLRWIQTEDLAKLLYGNDWAHQVKDVSDALFMDYEVGQPIAKAEDYTVQDVVNLYGTPDKVLFRKKLITSEWKNYTLPSQTVILTNNNGRGYSASSTFGMIDLVAWYKGNLNDAALLYEDSMANGSTNIKMLNFGSWFAGSVRHKSVVLTDSGSGRQIGYSDVIFPFGFIAYPRAVIGSNYAGNDEQASYSFVTTDTPDDVVYWYQENGPKNGWTVADYKQGNQYGGWSLTLKSKDGLKQLSLTWGTGTSSQGTQFMVMYQPQQQ